MIFILTPTWQNWSMWLGWLWFL